MRVEDGAVRYAPTIRALAATIASNCNHPKTNASVLVAREIVFVHYVEVEAVQIIPWRIAIAGASICSGTVIDPVHRLPGTGRCPLQPPAGCRTYTQVSLALAQDL